jgi:hypothetical protein
MEDASEAIDVTLWVAGAARAGRRPRITLFPATTSLASWPGFLSQEETELWEQVHRA